jgi:phosphatidylserine/phosphatidylglycerophosphate/cardiolipin synthase-like enzyme
MLEPRVNCWRIERATRASVIVDADDYFRLARAAMLKARKRIMLIGWDFDARIDLDRCADSNEGPTTIGDFVYWLVERNPELEVYLLRWDLGAVNTLFRGTTIFTVFKWMRHPRIQFKLDGAHPPTASHHQKIVVLDDSVAFCGGIDMTEERWDTRAHADDDPERRKVSGELADPWHDATTALEGPVAAALGDLARERWERAGGGQLPAVTGETDCWPVDLPVQFRDVDVAIARTAPELDERPAVLEIERLYLDLIARAERFIYLENQYFASHLIARALAARLAEEEGPEVVVVNPREAKGWLEPLFMDTTRARLREALRRYDRHDRFRIYYPVTQNGVPIYVHAKIMIVDDLVLRVGSSNLNSRSMRLDTECDVVIAATLAPNASCGETIRAFRDGLLAEHLGIAPQAVGAKIDECRSLIAAIEGLRGHGKTLRPYETPDLSAVEAWLAEHDVLAPSDDDEPYEPLVKRKRLPRLRLRRRREVSQARV